MAPTSKYEDAPTIKLGGKEYPIPMLAARQNRVIDPLILALLPVFSLWQADKMAGLAKITEVEYDKLLDISLHAVRRANPEMTREKFLDLPITLAELVAAFPIVARQTGVFQRGEPGEAPAAEGRSQTGTE